MSMKVWKVLGLSLAAACVLAAVVAQAMGGCADCVQTAAGGCVPMKCNYTMCAVALVQVMAALCCAALAFVKCKVGRRWLAVGGMAGQALMLVSLYTPFMGLCGKPEMHCHATAHVLTAFAVAVIVGCVVACAKADPNAVAKPKRGL
jgi:FtsH-binding integral membrane protein